MKLSDYVANFIAEKKIRHVFGITGGASLHLIHSVIKHPNVEFVFNLHEQASSMAADGTSRMFDGLGVAIGTSGPGATNMITGICGAYYDSLPVIFITGQVATFRFKGDSGVRQYGFQETDIVDICNSVTKYAVTVTDANDIRYELEKAYHIALDGRPGPVLVDIPDNLQREMIMPDSLPRFEAEKERKPINVSSVNKAVSLLSKSRRPILILGWGVRLANAELDAVRLIELLDIPVLLTWGAKDILSYEHPLNVGTFGTHGTRYGNFAVQNADLVLAIGTRLDTHETGSPPSSFAREAVKIVVDIDIAELNKTEKYGMRLDLSIEANAKEFISGLLANQKRLVVSDIGEWKQYINTCKQIYPICPAKNHIEVPVNPYVLIEQLSTLMSEEASIVIDTGCVIAWMMQAFRVKRGQRLLHDFNNTAMGYALPASIGVSLACKESMTLCVVGDGSLQMNIQELATVIHYKLPIKILLFNNFGYSMIRQTQDQWLDSDYVGSSSEGGLPAADFSELASSYGFETFEIARNDEIGEVLPKFLRSSGPAFCNLKLSSSHRVLPQVKFGRPIEDSDPLLSRKQYFDSMIIDSLDVSNLVE